MAIDTLAGRQDDLAIYPYEQGSQPRTLVDVFNKTAANHPEALAIDTGSVSLTYAAFQQRIKQQARVLHDAGIRAGDKIGIRLSSGTIELYSSILAILHIGAAYVPVDVDDPDERAELVFSEASIKAILTDGPQLTVCDNKASHTADQSQRHPAPEDDAYIIFTSGSTGKPKGVAVTHRNAAAFVDAEAILFADSNLGPQDRVLAGLSVAFDASVEEMWLAWRHGGCLVPVPRRLVKAGADLGSFLLEQMISVVSTVPTLATLWPDETFSHVRLLILGGEACTEGLASRLTSRVDAVWNTYGPTEATVVSCASRLQAGQPVSIGLPLSGWKLAVVDPVSGGPMRWGEQGELVIGGVGLAHYLDSEKDASKYPAMSVFGGERTYRSGDLVRAEQDGLYFLGRLDEQVKLNGRRIELGEIDAALMNLPGVTAAASTVQKSDVGCQVLVGYIVRKNTAVSSNDRQLLQQTLPSAMVPFVVILEELPVRSSGKVDRKALPWPPPAADDTSEADNNDTMAWVRKQWQRVLGVTVSSSSNFFDLGGSSLVAAQLVSLFREKCPTFSIADIYDYPTAEAMSDRIDDYLLDETTSPIREVKPVPWWTSLLQFPVMVFAALFNGLRLFFSLCLTKKIFAIYLGSDSWAGHHALPWGVLIPLFVLFLATPGRVLMCGVLVRLLNIKIKAGTYSRGGIQHLRLWAAERVIGAAGLHTIPGTPWANYYARLIGCKIGKDVQLHGKLPTTSLIEIDAGSSIGGEADIHGWWIDGDQVLIGDIRIGERATVGGRAVLMPNTHVKPYATVQAGTAVDGTVEGPLNDPEKYTPKSLPVSSWMRYTSTLLLLDIAPLLQIAPLYGLTATVVQDYSNFHELVLDLVYMALPSAVLGSLLYAALIICLVRLASIFIRPGSHDWHGRTAYAAWLTNATLLEARDMLFPLYASLLTPVWLKALGASIGKNVEASTVVPIPSLLTVGDDAFLADDVHIAGGEMERGRIWIGTSSVGERSFVGNSGIVRPDINVPAHSLIGVLGTAPAEMEAGTSWLGRPTMILPRRDITGLANEKRTFQPSLSLKLIRGFVESCRLSVIVIGGMLQNCVGIGMLWLMDTFGEGYAVLSVPALILGSGVVAALLTTIVKWIITPRIQDGQERPLWSNFVWRNELVDCFTQTLANPLFVRLASGTPLMNCWMRTMGARIGKGVWLDTHYLPEPELCRIGSGATINRGSVLQNHLFHDRIQRFGVVRVGKGATLGCYSIALLGTTIGDGATICSSSLVMRGESIPANTRWRGNPVRPWTQKKAKASSKTSSMSDDEIISEKSLDKSSTDNEK